MARLCACRRPIRTSSATWSVSRTSFRQVQPMPGRAKRTFSLSHCCRITSRCSAPGWRRPRCAKRLQPNLPLLFDAAALVNFSHPDTPAFHHMMQVHREMAARGIDTRRSFDRTVLSALIAARDFDQARAFASARPALAHDPVPNVIDPLGPRFEGRSVYRYDAGTNTLTRQLVPSLQLVMVVGAGCHFSKNALDAIRGDAELRGRLKAAELMLVTPPRAAIAFGFIADWNARNPDLPIGVPYHVREWREIDVDGVPRFYLFRNGKAVGRVSGWPDAGNKAALLEMIDKAGR